MQTVKKDVERIYEKMPIGSNGDLNDVKYIGWFEELSLAKIKLLIHKFAITLFCLMLQ